jgi:hypothetical protein
LGKGWEIERALTAVPDSHAPDSRRLAGRELKESFVELALKVYKRNVKSCEAALDAAFKADPIRAMKELVAYLPKDAVERAMPNTEKAIVRIELCQPAKQIEYIDAGGK